MINLEEVAEEIGKIALTLNDNLQLKESLKITCREAVRMCGEAISAIHRRALNIAESKLKLADEKIKQIMKNIKERPELISGSVIVAMQEYVEAKSLYEIVTRKRIPLNSELKVLEQAYVLGLADLIGELRRKAIDLLKAEEIEESERMVELMERLHEILQPLEYPRSLVPELRSKIDVMRRLIEDTRKIVAEAQLSIRLRKELEKIADKL